MTTLRRGVSRSLVAALIACVSIGTFATPAQSTNFSGITGLTGCNLNAADNRSHGYFYNTSQMVQYMIDATNWSRVNNADPTDLNTVLESTLTTATDVVGYSGDFSGTTCLGTYTWCCEAGSGIVGVVICESINSASECEQHKLYYDTDALVGGTTNYRRAVACHENGHTVGLAHIGGSCMNDPANEAQIGWSSTHDVVHINNHTGYDS